MTDRGDMTSACDSDIDPTIPTDTPPTFRPRPVAEARDMAKKSKIAKNEQR